MKEIIDNINKLRKEKNVIILGHTYTFGEVQNIADYVGDSYGLSKKAATVEDAEIILFAGVRFMAETAAILAPEKKVILPVENAGCPMADMIDEFQLQGLRKAHPDAAVVCYVNSTVETKAWSDVCVTSSNAVKIVKKLPNEKIIFVPDQHLGSYVAEQVPEKEVILWEGHCPIHSQVSSEDVIAAKKMFLDAVVIMHPECKKETRAEADYILSTGGMVDLVKKQKHKKYIIVTESGVIHTLEKHDESAQFIPLTAPALRCQNMKKIHLTDIEHALEKEETIVTVPEHIAQKARVALERMLELSE